MKKTGALNVLGDFSMKDEMLVIHPNDGFDLGMMTTSYPVYIFYGCSLSEFEEGKGSNTGGKILLENKCRLGTLEMGKRAWEKMGKPKKVELFYSEPNIFISPVLEKVET